MSVNMEKKHWIVLLLGIVLLCVITFFQYKTTVQPLEAEKERQMKELERWEEQAAALRSGTAESPGEQAAARFKYEQQLPRAPRPDQFLLDLDKAEEISNSYILSVERLGEGEWPFSEVEDEREALVIEEPEDPPEESVEPETARVSVPENVRTLSYMVTVRARAYTNVKRFVEVLDHSSRLIHIEKLQFTGEEEWVRKDQEREPIQVTLMVTAYYYPEAAETKSGGD
ncbi:hypothetical protein [Bacillus piscicola]|uniref:hypothetical protein n=1 Tax=Bacillus piscicola TaxID=1632684 RepID=UPI001F09BEF2|nr:hypothetical protein [Bacillus piscicola]